jgi:hypothetical protein
MSKCSCGCAEGKCKCKPGCKCGCNHKKGGASWAQKKSFEKAWKTVKIDPGLAALAVGGGYIGGKILGSPKVKNAAKNVGQKVAQTAKRGVQAAGKVAGASKRAMRAIGDELSGEAHIQAMRDFKEKSFEKAWSCELRGD